MLGLLLGCNQGGPRPYGKYTCSSYAQVCSFGRAVATMTRTFNQINSTQTFIII